MKAQTYLLISIPICLTLALVATSASYFYTTEETLVVDVGILYRGWPLYWMTESWSYWGRPPHGRYFAFQPLNFSIDVAFWMAVFQTSVLLYVYLTKRAQKREKENFQINLSHFGTLPRPLPEGLPVVLG